MSHTHSKKMRRMNILLSLAVLLNLVVAWLLYSRVDSALGWVAVSLNDEKSVGFTEELAIFQFLAFGFLTDIVFRRSVLKFNLRYKTVRIPSTVTQVMSILVYGFAALTGFILLFEHSINTLLAASGAIGLGLSYALKDWIAGIQAGIQIQFDRIFGIGDWIQVKGKAGDEPCEVHEIDRRMVTLENHDGQRFQVPSVEFINGNVINFTRQKIGQRRIVDIQIDAKYEANRILAILELALQYLVKNNPEMHDYRHCRISNIAPGHITYQIKYEFAPQVSTNVSHGLVLKTALRFLSAASINLESSVHIDRAVDPYDNNTRRLLEIRDQGILRALTFEEIVSLAARIRRREFGEGEHIVRVNEMGDSMYFLSEGYLAVNILKESGESVSVATLWPGDCFGEMSLLTGAPRSADVVAMTDVVVLEIGKEDLLPLMERNEGLASAIVKVLEDRNQQNLQAITGTAERGARSIADVGLLYKIMTHFGLSGLWSKVRDH